MENNFNFSSQKGVSILLAVLIMTVVLGMGLALNVFLVQQIRIMEDVGHSVAAFYAADSAIEAVSMAGTPTNISGTLPNGSSYEVFVKTGGQEDCPVELNYCIKAIGTYQATKRAIEIKY